MYSIQEVSQKTGLTAHTLRYYEKEGLLSGALNAASVAFIVANLCGGYWITGIAGGGIALNYTFMGNQQRTAALVEQRRTTDALAFGDRLRAFLLN